MSEQLSEQQDTEITLGTGKLLLLFFGLVVLCGAFFGIGYLIGKNSGTPQQVATETGLSNGSSDAVKPSSSLGTPRPVSKPQDCSTPGNCDQQSSGSAPFYDSVGDKNVTPKLEPPTANTPEQNSATSPSPELSKPAAPGSGYIVQVAAVSKQQDADTLVSALRKKQYPVFVTSNPPTDKLFHVQAGPFADIKEAEAVKSRLVNDGYSPILKR